MSRLLLGFGTVLTGLGLTTASGLMMGVSDEVRPAGAAHVASVPQTLAGGGGGAGAAIVTTPAPSTHYRTVKVDGLDIFYREAGPTTPPPPGQPTVLLLHGFPSSSHMFRNLIPELAKTHRVVAPDYPGFGNSSAPSVDEFEYSFDALASIVDKFTKVVGINTVVLYVQDYGAPIGYRIASNQPDRIRGIIVQNGNAYDEGLGTFWDPIRAYWNEQTAATREPLEKFLTIDGTKWQYTAGVRDTTAVSPDAWTVGQVGLDRPGNKAIQMKLFLSYRTNPPLYPVWQKYFRENQPPTLIVWGKNDPIFPAEGAEPYKRDLKNLDFNLLDTGHFALEEDGQVIANKIKVFLDERVK